MNGPTQKALGERLGLSPAAVSKLRKQGMPTHSVEAARAWRLANVRPTATANPARAHAEQLADLEALWPVARAALEAGRFEVVRPALRQALGRVPPAARHLVAVDFVVMDALCAAFIAALGEGQGEGEPVPRPPMTELDVEVMARVWYCVAAGEQFPAAWLGEGLPE